MTQHMAAHIAVMNVLAPSIALAFARQQLLPFGTRHLAPATILQICLLWGWHIPAVLGAAVQSPALMAAMHGLLFLAALWFWSVVVGEAQQRRWTPIAALLITGKLFCLLGVLLTFAPRALYWQVALIQSCFGATDLSLVADQQMAGLIMLTACPIVFVGTAILVARRWLARIGEEEGWRPGAETA